MQRIEQLQLEIEALSNEDFCWLRNSELLKENPSHPSLRFKKVGLSWSARVGSSHRALAARDGRDYIWVWIGDHDDFDRLVG